MQEYLKKAQKCFMFTFKRPAVAWMPGTVLELTQCSTLDRESGRYTL